MNVRQDIGRAVLIGWLCSLFLASGAAWAQESLPEYGDTLIVGEIGGRWAEINPIFHTLCSGQEVADYVFGRGLTSLDDEGGVVPELAESWQWSEDRKSVTFALRDGVRFHNDMPLESDDVVFTYTFYQQVRADPAHFYDKCYDRIRSVQALAADRVRFELKGHFDAFLPDLTGLQILCREVYEGRSYAETRDRILGLPPVGLGPFAFSSLEGRRIVLKANPAYYRGRPYLDGIVFQFYDTEELLHAAFVTGEIDFARIDGENSARDVWRSTSRIRLIPLILNQNVFESVCYNTSTSLFSSQVTRLALTQAINRVGMINEILGGKGNVAWGPLNEDAWAYYPNLPKVRFDPKGAMQLLREEGWSDRDKDGILERRGQKFRFTLMFPRGSIFFETMARIVKLDLKGIGVDMIPEPVGQEELLRRAKAGNFDAALMRFSFESGTEQYDEMFHSSSIGRGMNMMRYSSREVDRLIDLAYGISDRDRLEPIFQRLQLLIAQDQPCTFLFFKWLGYAAVDTRFQNVRRVVGGLNPFEHWFVPEKDRRYE